MSKVVGPGGGSTGVLGPAKPQSAQLWKSVFADDFLRSDTIVGGAGTSTGAGNGWLDIQGGVAQISGNRLKLTGDSIDSSQYKRDKVVRPISEATLDGEMYFDFPAQTWLSGATFGPLCRFQSGSKDCYQARWHGDGSNCQIYKVISGTATSIAGPAPFSAFSQSKNYRCRYAIQGTTISYEVSEVDTGVVVFNLQGTDSSISTAGTFGFSAPWDISGVSVYIDNVTISASSTLKLGLIGDSITSNIPPSGLKSPGASLARELGSRTRREFTVINRAISGTATSDWLSGGANLVAAKAAFATAGVTDIHIMLGTNDSKTAIALSKAAYKANMQNICSDLVLAGYRVFLSDQPYLVPGAYTLYDTNSLNLLAQYRSALDEICDGTAIIRGSKKTFQYFQKFQNQLTDLLHPTIDGGEALATIWAETIWTYFI